MPKSDLTKHQLAKTIKKLMEKTPLDKISVQNIVDECNINRKTFYYHFKDKQDLICWIFDTEFSSIHDINHDNTIMDELVEHLYKNKNFYVAALSSNSQNNLREHLYIIVHQAILSEITKTICSEKINRDDINNIASFFSNAVIGCLSQWVKEGMNKSPSEYISDYYHLIRDTLDYVVRKRINEKAQ